MDKKEQIGRLEKLREVCNDMFDKTTSNRLRTNIRDALASINKMIIALSKPEEKRKRG